MFVAHEYAHHVQKVEGFYYRKSLNLGMAIEGHARGVGRHMATLYSYKRDNPAYLYHYLSISVPELVQSYLWLCGKLGVTPRATSMESTKQFTRRGTGISQHALGNSLFQIYQRTKGEKMLSDIVHGKFLFPA